MKEPVVKNMLKGLYFQFTVGVLPLYAVAFVGYWAYGSDASAYLLDSVSGPHWVKTAANIAAFLQTVIALHVSLVHFVPFLVGICSSFTIFCLHFWPQSWMHL